MSTVKKFVTTLKENGARIVFVCFMLFGLAVLGLYGLKHFGTQYAEKQVQEQLEHAGLLPFVHYENLHFNPFTLTPSLENVRFGVDSAPWLKFSRISFNSYPLTYPNLDVDFWLQESKPEDLSYETEYWMHITGLKTLLGKGSIKSEIDEENVTTHIDLDIHNIGQLSIDSDITLLNSDVSMHEFRTDLLASIALGQPEAVLIIHGESIELNALSLEYEEQGLIHGWVPNPPATPEEEYELFETLRYSSEAFGLAYVDSQEADHIANVMLNFLSSPTKLKMTMAPKEPINLSDLVLFISNSHLYSMSNMTLSSPQQNISEHDNHE